MWGWRPARTILNATYTEIVVHGIGLAAIILAMPPDGLAYVIVAIPALEWMVTLPFYLFVPLFLIWRGVRRFKTRELSLLRDTARGTGTFSVKVATRGDRLNSISADPLPALLVGNALPDRADRQHRHLHRPWNAITWTESAHLVDTSLRLDCRFDEAGGRHRRECGR